MPEDAIGAFQNDIDALEDLEDIRYENIFKVYIKDKKYFYNLLKRVSLSSDINNTSYDMVQVQLDTSWPILSYKVYNTTYLWWIIAAVNNIINPLEGVSGGTVIKIIKPNYVRLLLEEINEELSPNV